MFFCVIRFLVKLFCPRRPRLAVRYDMVSLASSLSLRDKYGSDPSETAAALGHSCMHPATWAALEFLSNYPSILIDHAAVSRNPCIRAPNATKITENISTFTFFHTTTEKCLHHYSDLNLPS